MIDIDKENRFIKMLSYDARREYKGSVEVSICQCKQPFIKADGKIKGKELGLDFQDTCCARCRAKFKRKLLRNLRAIRRRRAFENKT